MLSKNSISHFERETKDNLQSQTIMRFVQLKVRQQTLKHRVPHFPGLVDSQFLAA